MAPTRIVNELLPEIRNAVRAVVVRDRQVLVLRKDGDTRGERFALPGGGQTPGESLIEALQRECLEEIGSEVSVGSLLRVADFYKQRPGPPPSRRHLVEFLFACEVPAQYVPRSGTHPDKHQVGVQWMPIAKLGGVSFSPFFLKDVITRLDMDPPAAYLGTYADHATT